jgi:hypothetical protein
MKKVSRRMGDIYTAAISRQDCNGTSRPGGDGLHMASREVRVLEMKIKIAGTCEHTAAPGCVGGTTYAFDCSGNS